MEQSESAPAHCGKPRPRRDHGRTCRDPLNRRPPALEPPAGRPRIHTACARHVLSPVLQHIDQRVPDLPRRPEGPGMIAVPPHAPPAPEDPVHTLRDPDGEALKPAREHAHIECFDEEMNVIALDAYSTLRTAPRCASSA